MSIPIDTAREMVRNCVPQCTASEVEFFIDPNVVFVNDANAYVYRDCVTKCYEVAKAAFRAAAEVPKVVSDTSTKMVNVAVEEITSEASSDRWLYIAAAVILFTFILFRMGRK